MNNALMFSSNSDEWYTPQNVFDRLNAEFLFDVDLAADQEKTSPPMGRILIMPMSEFESERQELLGQVSELTEKLANSLAVAEHLHAGNLERIKLLDSWAELHADRNMLRKWRDDVTSACGRVGGLRFDGVASEIRRLKSAYVSLSEAVWPGCRSSEDIEAASPSALVKDALLHREAYDRINDDARRVREDGFRDHTHAVAYDFVRYYVDGTDGCRNCGGFPHSSECFVGRFVIALGLDSTATTAARITRASVRVALELP